MSGALRPASARSPSTRSTAACRWISFFTSVEADQASSSASSSSTVFRRLGLGRPRLRLGRLARARQERSATGAPGRSQARVRRRSGIDLRGPASLRWTAPSWGSRLERPRRRRLGGDLARRGGSAQLRGGGRGGRLPMARGSGSPSDVRPTGDVAERGRVRRGAARPLRRSRLMLGRRRDTVAAAAGRAIRHAFCLFLVQLVLVRGRRYRSAPTATMSLLAAQGSSRAPAYAAALGDVALEAAALGEPDPRATGPPTSPPSRSCASPPRARSRPRSATRSPPRCSSS